ncbi:endonuclease/exonuclease/phosphatase, putative [Bodo saltans]|uniref:Endonuclease/exonuclease/phosphatase, putative n=1 Tax=Bodo saltans TaxID=75058 RepID=A0A0S4J788_BODSA|nr:endonuclease/exonuclease/phosphatase, putative [Bodo saltans]|eukprot:CUG87345.1 endonuclease/exonuclease/phosphatase, putative [Bodo saltans]
MASVNPMVHTESREVDDVNDGDVNVPFEIDDETFPVPPRCYDEVDSTDHVRGLWAPGLPLIISYVTWNMAQTRPAPQEVADFCVRPNAHLVVVCTQENGPYVGLNTQHVEWEQLIEDVCLQGKYVRVATKSLWAIHLGVYARLHDVALYVREVHVGVQKTGAGKGALGNKGGAAIGLTVSLRQSTMHKALESLDSSRQRPFLTSAGVVAEDDKVVLAGSLVDAYSAGNNTQQNSGSADQTEAANLFTPSEGERGTQRLNSRPPPLAPLTSPATRFSRFISSLKTTDAASGMPAEMTLLFVGTHLTAHQHNTEARNRDYHSIIRELPVGTRGVYRNKFLRTLRLSEASVDGRRGGGEKLSSTVVSPHTATNSGATPTDATNNDLLAATANDDNIPLTRDASDEFDICLFGGDLNYRLNGSWRAIEFIINHRKTLRSVLVHNDQLIANMNQGKVFCGFREGQLHFRPTYKYALIHGVTQDDYAFSHKNPRMPSYCDRVLIRSRKGTSQHFPAQQVLYTDCPEVRTSDHRPVVSMWRVETALTLDGVEGDDSPAEANNVASCACFVFGKD